jgi:hypothetical protein
MAASLEKEALGRGRHTGGRELTTRWVGRGELHSL